MTPVAIYVTVLQATGRLTSLVTRDTATRRTGASSSPRLRPVSRVSAFVRLSCLL